MKKILNMMSIIAAGAIIMVSCDGPGQCLEPHYVNPSPRNAKDFSSDTLTMEQLAEKYMSLIDGDTIVVCGILDSKELGWGVFVDNYTFYLHGNTNPDPLLPYQSSNVQFLKEWELWLDSKEGMSSIEPGTNVVAKGVIHFYHEGPGVNGNNHPGLCWEKSVLDVLDIIIEED